MFACQFLSLCHCVRSLLEITHLTESFNWLWPDTVVFGRLRCNDCDRSLCLCLKPQLKFEGGLRSRTNEHVPDSWQVGYAQHIASH